MNESDFFRPGPNWRWHHRLKCWQVLPAAQAFEDKQPPPIIAPKGYPNGRKIRASYSTKAQHNHDTKKPK